MLVLKNHYDLQFLNVEHSLSVQVKLLNIIIANKQIFTTWTFPTAGNAARDISAHTKKVTLAIWHHSRKDHINQGFSIGGKFTYFWGKN